LARAVCFAADGRAPASIAPADRRNDRTKQVALSSRITVPSYRPAAARKITDTVAFHARRRTIELADNCYSLVVFMDLGLNFANTGVIGGNSVADYLRIRGGDVARAIGRRH
jgi:hypothetical protein